MGEGSRAEMVLNNSYGFPDSIFYMVATIFGHCLANSSQEQPRWPFLKKLGSGCKMAPRSILGLRLELFEKSKLKMKLQ